MRAELADGRILEFPDGTDPSVIQATVKRLVAGANSSHPAQQPAVERAYNPTQDMSGMERFTAGAGKAVADMGRGIRQALAEDHRLAWMLDKVGIDREIADARERDAALMETGAGMAGNIAGNVAAMAPAAFVPGANTMAGAATIGALSGTLIPTVGDDSRVGNAAFGAGTSMLGQYAGKKGAEYLGKKIAAADKAPPLLSTDDLKSAAQQQYAVARNAGVVVTPNSYERAVKGIASDLRSAGYHPKLHPRVSAALEELQANVGTPKSLDDLDLIRRVANNAAASIQPDERRIARAVIEKLDDYVDGLQPTDLVTGDSKQAVTALQSARGLWQKVKKAELLDSIFEKAKNSSPQYSQSGMENALRVKFRAVADNPKLMRQFSPAERKAIQGIVRGGGIQNALRLLGKLAPSGVVSGGIGATAGYAVGGPVGAIALPAAGWAGKTGAAAMGLGKYKALNEGVRRGVMNAPTAGLMSRLGFGALDNAQAQTLLGLMGPALIGASQQ